MLFDNTSISTELNTKFLMIQIQHPPSTIHHCPELQAKDYLDSLSPLSLTLFFPGYVLNSSKGISLGLRGCDVFDIVSEVRATLLSVPCMWSVFAEQDLDLFKSLSTGLFKESAWGVRVPCNCLTSGYVKKNWIDARIQSTPKTTKSPHLMLMKAGGMKRPMAKLNSQFPIAAIPIPEARVSSDHTSAA
jgi:hypothetical protein